MIGKIALGFAAALLLPLAAHAQTGPGCAGATIQNTKTAPFSSAGAATTIKLVAGATGQNIIICGAAVFPVAGAVNVNFISGTKVTNECDTTPATLFGGTTAATGANLAINGGWVWGNGQGILASTSATGKDVCVVFSGAVQVSGSITYTQR